MSKDLARIKASSTPRLFSEPPRATVAVPMAG